LFRKFYTLIAAALLGLLASGTPINALEICLRRWRWLVKYGKARLIRAAVDANASISEMRLTTG
jgi:hypothetical protein